MERGGAAWIQLIDRLIWLNEPTHPLTRLNRGTRSSSVLASASGMGGGSSSLLRPASSALLLSSPLEGAAGAALLRPARRWMMSDGNGEKKEGNKPEEGKVSRVRALGCWVGWRGGVVLERGRVSTVLMPLLSVVD